MAVPALLPAFSELVLPRPGVSKRVYVRAVARALALGGSQLACHLAFLAHQAWLMGDAIVRTLVRLGVTRRTMLEWVTAGRSEARILRSVARRTWRFFETLVGPADNHLPPDNLQEDPEPVVAHRTSPTNIGLYLLSTAAARDFGWIGTLDTVERLESTLASMGRLERFRGHFYNWYETRELRPLEPRYVSTVDSGNLAGHLIVLGNACREMMERTPDSDEALRGIEDALLSR